LVGHLVLVVGKLWRKDQFID